MPTEERLPSTARDRCVERYESRRGAYRGLDKNFCENGAGRGTPQGLPVFTIRTVALEPSLKAGISFLAAKTVRRYLSRKALEHHCLVCDRLRLENVLQGISQ